MGFPYLFSPIAINGMTLKNRIVMAAMHLSYTPDGAVTDRLVEFYVQRAKGGVGLIIVGGCVVDEYAGMKNMIQINDNQFMPGLKKLTTAVRKNGAKISAQLYHAGRYAHSSMLDGRKPFSASAIRSKFTGETPRALELEEIPKVQDRFAAAAARAKECGFDAVEILGSAGYLISQFLSPLTNSRQDKYGGSQDNRMRFGLEVMQKVRKAVGPDFPVAIRLAGNDFMEGGNTNQEAARFAAALEKAGADLLNITGGWHETRVPQLTMSVPPGAFVYLAQGVKSAVSIPVLASNRINDPHTGEAIISLGQADLVTMARALLADPDLPNKARKGQSRRIYHCVACNQGCFDNIFKSVPATCLVNPMAGNEADWQICHASEPKNVLVIGGGPAGMKAACTLSERGHSVTLVEAAESLGGQILLNRLIPGRSEFLHAATDLVNNISALGINVLLETKADAAFVKNAAPDAVVVATGASAFFPNIPGIEGQNVVCARDLLAGKVSVGKHVVVVGGNGVGLETALYAGSIGTLSAEGLYFLLKNHAEPPETLAQLLNRGCKQVTVVEMKSKAGESLGASTRWVILSELKRLGVKIMTHTRASGITSDGLEIERKDGQHFLPADSIVMATGSRSDRRLANELKTTIPELYIIGDAKEPRDALTAIREGMLAGMTI